jgi:hypothetical protein
MRSLRGRPNERLSHVLLYAAIAAFLLLPASARPGDAGRHLNPPRHLALVEASTTRLSFSWDSHGAAPDGFELFLDDTRVATTSAKRYTFTALRCGSSYTVGVEAFASDGGRSRPASVVAATDPCAGAAPAPHSPEPPPPPSPKPPPKPPSPAPEPPSEPEPEPGNDDADWPTASEPPAPVAMSWDTAGAFVWHEEALDPVELGQDLRANGFGWIALMVHDGLTVDPIDYAWAVRFREASGLPLGGWGALRTQPEQEAALAHDLVARYHLDFYIANPELEYKFTDDRDQDAERFDRSSRFVRAFRGLSPTLPAGISSYCRADRQDLDWRTWGAAGFAFLPQAYVNDFGDAASPAACVAGAEGFFSSGSVHPTIGVYGGQRGRPELDTYATLLTDAGTVGFSVYLAENSMRSGDWSVLGRAIRERGIALDPEDPTAALAIRPDPNTILPPSRPFRPDHRIGRLETRT